MKRIFCLLMVCLILTGCTKDTPDQRTVFAMDTVMDLQVWGKDRAAALEQAEAFLRDLENTWSVTDENSLLSALNRGEDPSMTAEHSALLQQAEALSVRTAGAFDPKLYAVSKAWGFYGEDRKVPSKTELAVAMSKNQWDMGGVLKGYAGGALALMLAGMNVDRAILNLGGNIQTYGEKPDGQPWVIGIQNPDGGDYLGRVSVRGTMAVVSSGDYQRYFEADGVKYHHIIDPKTGYPARSGLRSVTVICRDGMTADALSTALFVMGLGQGSAHWREHGDFEAIFVTDSGKIYATEGVKLSGCEFEVIVREQ